MNQEFKKELQQLIKKYQPEIKLVTDGRLEQKMLEVTKNKQVIKIPILDSITQINSITF